MLEQNMREQPHHIEVDCKVLGMTCASCAVSLETHLKKTAGVEQVVVNYANHSLQLVYDETTLSLQEISTSSKKMGYELLTHEGEQSTNSFETRKRQRLQELKIKTIIAIIFSTPIFIWSMFDFGKIPYENWIMMGLALPVLGWSGRGFYIHAWNKIRVGTTNMDTLVALSTGIAFIFSVSSTIVPYIFELQGIQPHVYYESSVVIITLVLLGKYLEERAQEKTSHAIKQLIELQPAEVTVIRNGEEVRIPYEEIIRGDLICIQPGERIPVDGKVKKGESYIDESTITGESMPVAKSKKSKVYAGTMNQQGALRILATNIGEETILAKIIQQVQKAQASKPKLQKKLDKIASVFVPVVLLISVVTFLSWYGYTHHVTMALVSTMTVLIVACPCALGLAAPTALIVGIGKGATNGILIKNAEALETLHQTDVLVLDKTGTITEGKPVVTEIIWVDDHESEENKQILSAIEKLSEHPIANAIVNGIHIETKPTIDIDDFLSMTGLGVKAKVSNKSYIIGHEQTMRHNKVTIPQDIYDKMKKWAVGTTVYFSCETILLAAIQVRDQVKPNAKEVIQALHELKIEVLLATGDNEKVAQSIGNEIGVQQIHAHLLPADKGQLIKELQAKGKRVTMIGDGVNDAPALALANTSMAMGSGTDIAIESADVTLMNSDLKSVLKTLKLARFTMKTIRQNLFWAFVYNLVAIPLAAGVLYPWNGFLINPMIAGVAMSLSSISVVLNSVRLHQKKMI